MQKIIILMLFILPISVEASEITGKLNVHLNIHLNSEEQSSGGGRAILSSPAGDDTVKSNKVEKQESLEEEKINVLGISSYAEGTLLRCGEKVYVLENGMRRHIRSLEELEAYRGLEIIDISKKERDKYQEKSFCNGSLIRGSDMRIYFVEGNSRKHILSLAELGRDYFGIKIYDVEDYIIKMFVLS